MIFQLIVATIGSTLHLKIRSLRSDFGAVNDDSHITIQRLEATWQVLLYFAAWEPDVVVQHHNVEELNQETCDSTLELHQNHEQLIDGAYISLLSTIHKR